MVTAMPSDDSVNRDRGPQELAEQANALISQLNYAGQVRSNYENQLLNLQAALQSERKNKGEHQLKLHDLEQAIEGLKRNEAELLSQIEHWRRKAHSAMEQRALASSQPETQDQILHDIERLQQGEAYWRRQASHLTQQYEQAEDDVRRLIREVQTRAEMIKEKENTERVLRQEIQSLNQKLKDSMSVQSSPRTEIPSAASKFHARTGAAINDFENEEIMTTFARVIKLQTILLHQGSYEEAERLALSFHENPSVINEIESARSQANYSPRHNRESNYNLNTPRSERSIPSQWIRSTDTSPNGNSSSQPNSTAPPLYQKLALENRLASFPHSVPVDSSQRFDHETLWAVKVGILEAINLPGMTTSDGSQIPAEYYACVSLVHADTDFSSSHLKSLEHIHGNQSARSWLLGQVHGIAWIQGHLKVRAMGKTSSVKYVNNAAHWAEAFVLRAIHADALEATNSMSEFSSESLPLDGRPAIILVTIHHARDELYGRMIARASLVIRAGEEFHQWYKLNDMDGKPLLAGPSKPAMLRIRSAYSRSSLDEPTHDKSGSPTTRGDVEKLPVAVQNAHRVEEAPSRSKGNENGTVVSATLGFFSMTAESDGVKPSSLPTVGGEGRNFDNVSQPSSTNVSNSKSDGVRNFIPPPSQSFNTSFNDAKASIQVSASNSQGAVTSKSPDLIEVEKKPLPYKTNTFQSPQQMAPMTKVSVTSPASALPMALSDLAPTPSQHSSASRERIITDSKVVDDTSTTNQQTSSQNQLNVAASRQIRPPEANVSPGNPAPSNAKSASREVNSVERLSAPFRAVGSDSTTVEGTTQATKTGTDPPTSQSYVLPRAKVLPVQQVSPFKLQEISGAKETGGKSVQNRPLSSKVADTIARLDSSRKSSGNHDPDFIARDSNVSNNQSPVPAHKREPPTQSTSTREAVPQEKPVPNTQESSGQWVARTVELTRTAPAGKQNTGRVGVGIAIASHGSGQPFVTALAPNGPAKLSGQIAEGDRIIAVNGTSVSGMNVYNIIQLILGDSGSVVRLDIEAPKNDVRALPASVTGSMNGSMSRQRAPEAMMSPRQSTEPKASNESVGKQSRYLDTSKSQGEVARNAFASPDPPNQSKQPNGSDPEPQGSISVKVLKATKIRMLDGDKKPNPSIQLRISGGLPPESRYKTASVADTTTPEWNETITLPVLDVDRAQLECSIWHEASNTSQASASEGFLGEVVLNLSKLKPYQGKYIEQVFEVKPSKVYACDRVATGKLKLGLKLCVPAAAGPFSRPWKSSSAASLPSP